MRLKRGEILNQAIIHIILVAVILALFMIATADKVNGRGVKQQVLEKEIALLIDSAVPGMSFTIEKKSVNGYISSIEVNNKDGLVHVEIGNLKSFKGYPFFTKHNVFVQDNGNSFTVKVQ